MGPKGIEYTHTGFFTFVGALWTGNDHVTRRFVIPALVTVPGPLFTLYFFDTIAGLGGYSVPFGSIGGFSACIRDRGAGNGPIQGMGPRDDRTWMDRGIHPIKIIGWVGIPATGIGWRGYLDHWPVIACVTHASRLGGDLHRHWYIGDGGDDADCDGQETPTVGHAHDSLYCHRIDHSTMHG